MFSVPFRSGSPLPVAEFFPGGGGGGRGGESLLRLQPSDASPLLFHDITAELSYLTRTSSNNGTFTEGELAGLRYLCIDALIDVLYF